VKSLRQVLIFSLTAVVAITAGRMLRDFVDNGSSPSPTPAISVPVTIPSPSPSGPTASP
jgi:hypothetical protein